VSVVSTPDRTLSYGDEPDAGDTRFVAPYLVLALRCDRPTSLPKRLSIAEVNEVRIGRGAASGHERITRGGAGILEIAEPDIWLSSAHARLIRDGQNWNVEDAGSKNGTFVRGARVTSHTLEDGDVIEAGGTLFLFRDCEQRDARDPADLIVCSPSSATTLSPSLARTLAATVRLASADVSIVIAGETGTGKEVIARLVHDASGRRGRFVAVNCGALPEALIEGELFGYRKGAFSGASEDRPGLVRAAGGGTLFLDEIAELPANSQATLLRVLQEREVLPLGETRPVAVDVRVIAATHKDLESAAEAGEFRADLLARLAGHRTELLPVRRRREDIGLLVAVLLARVAGDRASSLRLEREAARAIMHYDWPRNVREIEQALRAAVALAEGDVIKLAHLPQALREARPDEVSRREQLIRLLREYAGNVSSVARDMGKARVQIRRWCKRYDIDIDSFRTGQDSLK